MLSSKAAYTEGTSRIHFLNFLACHPLLLPLAWCRLIILYTSSRVEFKQLHPVCHGDRKWVSSFRWFPNSHLGNLRFQCGLFRCTGAFAALAELCYKPTVGLLGWRLVGWRMGIRGSLWRSCWIIHVSPPCLPPFLSAVHRLRPTVWVKDPWLSPSLNLKWGALSWFSQQFIWKQLQDTAIMIPQGITGAETGLNLHQNFSKKNSPEAILLSSLWK